MIYNFGVSENGVDPVEATISCLFNIQGEVPQLSFLA